MAHGPRWRRRPTERPSEILQAALEVFAEQGLARARVEDIAKRAGVSKGTVYLYFTGKEDLFREALRDRVARTLEGLSAAASQGDPAERLERFIDAYWLQLRRPSFGAMYVLLLAELPQFPELSRFYAEEVSGKVVQLSAAIIREGSESGQFREIDPLVASRMMVSLLVQHAIWTSRPELFPHLGTRDSADIVTEIKQFTLSALVCAPGRAA